MTKIKTCCALIAALALMLFSGESLSAAQAAVYGFWKSFLPAMLPFFLLAPYLTGPDAQAVFARLFGRVLPLLLRVPGCAAGALLCGLIAGSPAGALACAGLRARMNRGEYRRACFLASGLSPGFLLTALGSGYLADPVAGRILFFSHTAALLLSGLLLRTFGDEPGAGESARISPPPAPDLFVQALVNLGRVLCWMTAFGVLSALLGLWLAPVVPGWILSPLCEISGGAAALALAPLPEDMRLVLMAFCTGFGGACVLMQNLFASGLKLRELLPVKLLHALFSSACTYLLLHAPALPPVSLPRDLLGLSTASALALVLAVFLLARLRAKNRVDARP